MIIQWLGHACFKLSAQDASLVIDPYHPDLIPGLHALHIEANQVVCSHDHDDHNYKKAVTLLRSESPSPFRITRIPTFHDDDFGKKRGINIIHLIETDSLRVAHFGDLGCSLTKEQVQQLSHLDVLMIPIGGTYTIHSRKAKELVQILLPRIIIPMHYRSDRFGFEVLERIESFLLLFDPSFVMYYETDTIEITKEMKEQIAVLKYIG